MKSWYVYIRITKKFMLFKMVMLNIMKVTSGVSQGLGENLQHIFVICPNECATKVKLKDKMYWQLYIILRVVCSIRSVCARRIVWWIQCNGIVRGGIGRFTESRKNENGEKRLNFKMTNIAIYRPQYRLISTMLSHNNWGKWPKYMP